MFVHAPLRSLIAAKLFATFTLLAAVQAQLYTGTNSTGLWNSSRWSTSSSGPYGSSWTANTNSLFLSEGTYTFTGAISSGTVNVGNVTIQSNVTVRFSSALGNFGTGASVRTIEVGSGSIFDMGAQSISGTAGTGFIKTGEGVWYSANANIYQGPFTLNGGTFSAGGFFAMGSGASKVLTLINGVLASDANRDFNDRKFGGGIRLFGDIQFGAMSNSYATNARSRIGDSAGLAFANNVDLGGSTRTMTIGNNGAHTFSGVISNGGLVIAAAPGVTGTMTLTGANTHTGGTLISGGRLIGTATSLQGAITNNATVEFSQGSDSTLAASLTGSGAVVKSGAGAMTIANAQNYTGATIVNGGTLVVDGSISNSIVTVDNGGILSGGGSVGGIVVNLGGTISPGSSPGTLNATTNVVWNGGGNYNWQIFNASGTKGSTNGWDLLNTSGSLDLTSLSVANQFKINLWSLSGISPDTNGSAIFFTNTSSYTWTILTASNGITGFSEDKFLINTVATNGTGGFANALGGGTFSVMQSGNDLNLVFTSAPVPEPGTWAAATLLVGGAAFVRWRKRRKLG